MGTLPALIIVRRQVMRYLHYILAVISLSGLIFIGCTHQDQHQPSKQSQSAFQLEEKIAQISKQSLLKPLESRKKVKKFNDLKLNSMLVSSQWNLIAGEVKLKPVKNTIRYLLEINLLDGEGPVQLKSRFNRFESKQIQLSSQNKNVHGVAFCVTTLCKDFFIVLDKNKEQKVLFLGANHFLYTLKPGAKSLYDSEILRNLSVHNIQEQAKGDKDVEMALIYLKKFTGKTMKLSGEQTKKEQIKLIHKTIQKNRNPSSVSI